jgi:hypothetical protein
LEFSNSLKNDERHRKLFDFFFCKRGSEILSAIIFRVGWKKPAWKKPLVLTGKNQTEKPRHFKGKTGFSWVFGGFFNFYEDFF